MTAPAGRCRQGFPRDDELVVVPQAVDAVLVAAGLESIQDLAARHVGVGTSERRHRRSGA